MSKKRKSRIAILLIVAIFAVIAVYGFYQNPFRSLSAQEYFEVMKAGVISGQVESNGSIYVVYAISVEFKAVHGDAHDVAIQSWGNGDPILVGTMLKETPKTVELISTNGVLLRQSNGFTTEITIRSAEASGKISFPVSA